VVDVIGDMAVDTRASPSDHIALGDNVVGASGAKGNGTRNSAVVNVANAEGLVVDAHELTGSWARDLFASASAGSVVGGAGVAGSRGHGGSADSCGQSGNRNVRRRSCCVGSRSSGRSASRRTGRVGSRSCTIRASSGCRSTGTREQQRVSRSAGDSLSDTCRHVG
jgi:hypothetical protein